MNVRSGHIPRLRAVVGPCRFDLAGSGLGLARGVTQITRYGMIPSGNLDDQLADHIGGLAHVL